MINLLDISLIEFIVYGLVAYSGAVLLIISSFRETPATKSHSLLRAGFISLSVIACMILSGSGVNINMETTTTDGVIINLNSTEVTTSTVTQTSVFTLQNPVWIVFHYLLAVTMVIYILVQVLTLLTLREV